MNNKHLKFILQKRAEEIAPDSEINLWPAIRKHFTSYHAVLLTHEGGSKMKGVKQNAKVIVPIVLALLLIAVLVALTPQGRALANSIISFFTTTDQTSFPVPISQLPVSLNDTQTYLLELVSVQPNSSSIAHSDNTEQNCEDAALLTYACRIASAESKVGFDAKEFPADPQGVAFSNIEADAVQGEIKISYQVIGGGGWIDLRQGIGEIPDGLWAQVPAEVVEAALIGDIHGEYVQGIFTSDGSGEAIWTPDAASLRLRWQDGERWFSLEKYGNPYPIEYLGREEMIAQAVSLVDRPQQESQLRADYLTSIRDAKTLSGMELKEPTLLPEGFGFSFAQYDSQIHTVRLVFNLLSQSGDAKLVIIATPLKNDGETEEGYSEGEGHQALSWIADNLYITILFTHSQTFGGRLDEAKMTAIAESMR